MTQKPWEKISEALRFKYIFLCSQDPYLSLDGQTFAADGNACLEALVDGLLVSALPLRPPVSGTVPPQ